MIADRVAGLLRGLCLGDEAARGSTDLGAVSRAVLASARRLCTDAVDGEALRRGGDDEPDLVLAMAAPVAVMIAPRQHQTFDLVNAGWLDHLIGRTVGDGVAPVDIDATGCVVHSLALRLLDVREPEALRSPDSWLTRPNPVDDLRSALRSGQRFSVDATASVVLRTAADAFGLVRTCPTVDEALGAVRGMPPTAAALAIGMLGARHGASALPPSASDATHEADGLAALLLSLTLRDETRRP